MTFREFIYPSWIRLTRINRQAMRKSSDRGRLMQTSTFICGAVGLDTDLSFVYQLFSLMACILIASRISLRFQIPEVSVRRQLPKYATAGEPFEYFVNVANEGHRVERDLSVMDNPRVVPPEFQQFRQSKEPGEETRNAYDRWIGWHRFVWLQRVNTGINVITGHVPDIDMRGSELATMKATPLRRGAVHFESTTILHPDPLGLNYGLVDFESREQLTVLPRRYPVSRRFEFEGGRHFQPGGVNSTWSIGESDEFVSLRDYRDGDPIRKIHWASSAKRFKPVVKEFQDEFFVRQALVVDTFQQDPEIFEEVISVGASLLTAFNNADGLMDLCFQSSRPEVITAGRGYAQVSQQLEALAMLNQSDSDPADLIEMLSERSRLMSGCLLVFAGMDTPRLELIKAIEHRGVQTAVFVIRREGDATPMRSDFHLLEMGSVEAGMADL
ncbi:MAG: DUF58 domain-containing protein [Gammaproteobacteria bacterium]|jgi:hypothetical protein|nr:DUF58 domain-containing protein [Gammaproteobacteria bacterium]MBT7371621.1 DUF58 domain-containing protein [Gammaproteobacteria bacterium]